MVQSTVTGHDHGGKLQILSGPNNDLEGVMGLQVMVIDSTASPCAIGLILAVVGMAAAGMVGTDVARAGGIQV